MSRRHSATGGVGRLYPGDEAYELDKTISVLSPTQILALIRQWVI
ncbi:MAG: hypothetical protein OXB94_12615 [Nitrospira sp.]|nr:hypothetical protein [Nitrospira sp.]